MNKTYYSKYIQQGMGEYTLNCTDTGCANSLCSKLPHVITERLNNVELFTDYFKYFTEQTQMTTDD